MFMCVAYTVTAERRQGSRTVEIVLRLLGNGHTLLDVATESGLCHQQLGIHRLRRCLVPYPYTNTATMTSSINTMTS